MQKFTASVNCILSYEYRYIDCKVQTILSWYYFNNTLFGINTDFKPFLGLETFPCAMMDQTRKSMIDFFWRVKK